MRFRKKEDEFYRRRGFTIVEVTVVIVIIGILASLATFLFTDYQKRNRDTVRETNIEILHNALERYYGDNGAYPSVVTMVASGSSGNDCSQGSFYTDQPCNYEILGIDEDIVVAPGAPADTTNSVVRPESVEGTGQPTTDVYVYEGLGVGDECQSEDYFSATETSNTSRQYASLDPIQIAALGDAEWCPGYNLSYWSEVEGQWVEVASINKPGEL